MSNSRAVQDPGWGRPLKVIGAMVFMVFRFRRRKAKSDFTLVELRELQIAFLVMIVWVGFIVVLVSSSIETTTSPGAIAAGVILFGVLMTVVSRSIDRPLDASASADLASFWRTRFFLRTAFAQSASLVGFVGFLIGGGVWAYLAGLPLTVLGHLRAAPSRANIERDQEQLRRDGFDVNLLAVLVGEDASGIEA